MAGDIVLNYGQAYHINGWTILPSFDGTRFTNESVARTDSHRRRPVECRAAAVERRPYTVGSHVRSMWCARRRARGRLGDQRGLRQARASARSGIASAGG